MFFLYFYGQCLFLLVFTNVESFQTLPIGTHRSKKHKGIHQPSIRHVTGKDTTSIKIESSRNQWNNGKFDKNFNNRTNKRGYPRNNQQRGNKFRDLNQKIVSCESAGDILSLLASTPGALTKTSGGNAINDINFSTSIHRIARYVSRQKDERLKVLSDPKFGLFLCSFAEILMGMDPELPLSSLKDTFSDQTIDYPKTFTVRGRTNLVWALAKLRIVPPSDALPLIDRKVIGRELLKTSFKLRYEILASQKTKDKAWISTLSLLAAQLMDTVTYSFAELDEKGTENLQEIVNAIWSISTAQRSNALTFDQISSICVAFFEKKTTLPKPQELSITLWSFANSKRVTGSQSKILEHLSIFLEDPEWIKTFKTQELANTAWGISILINLRRESGEANNGTLEQKKEDLSVCKILRHLARAMIERCDEYKPQEMSNTVYAFGILGFGIGANNMERKISNDYVILMSDDVNGDENLVNQMLTRVENSAIQRLSSFKAQELNNLAYGCARIYKQQPDLFQGIADELLKRNRIQGQDISATLWSFATTEFFDPVAFTNILSHARIDARNYFKPQEISNVIWAIGTAGVKPKYPKVFDTSFISKDEQHTFKEISQDPVTLAFAISAKELLHRIQEYKPQEIKDTLWGFSKAGVRHPLLFKSVAEYLVGPVTDEVPKSQLHTGIGLDHFSPQEIGNLCWAFAKQAQLASLNSDYFSGRTAVYCSMTVDSGETLLKRLINCAVEVELEKFEDLSRLSTIDLSNTLWSFATLGFRFDKFIALVIKQFLSRCQSSSDQPSRNIFLGQEITNILWSLATLNAITPEVIDTIEPYIISHCGDGSASSISKFFNRQELGNILWCCTVADHYPTRLVRLLQRGMIGETVNEQNPTYMDKLYDGVGLAEQCVVTLVYLHAGMQLAGLREQKELPAGFPNGWGVFQDLNQLEDESGMKLHLTTSKIQKDVANAFTRIGFEIVEEHIVPFPDELPDLISLDIANIPQKIGIEVDGPSHYYHNLDLWSPQDPPDKGGFKFSNKQMEYSLDWNSAHIRTNGSTSLKNRLLEKLGWTIVHIPFWEWYNLKSDKLAEENYCREALNNIS